MKFSIGHIRLVRNIVWTFFLFMSHITPLVICLNLTPLDAAIQGKVVNATTGKPAPGSMVTLIKFGGEQGMAPVAEMYTEADGSFLFDDKILGSQSQSTHAMLRAEHEGIAYTQMITPGSELDKIEVTVYDIATTETPAPQMTAFLFEPQAGRLVINQFFQFTNRVTPPRTFSDSVKGTLRFNLPPAAQGEVEIRTTGPTGMPLRSSARKIPGSDAYMVDYPLKPGDSLIELTYSLPYESGEPYFGQLLYSNLETRFVIPEGVTIEAENLDLLGREPQSKASIYQHNGSSGFSLRLRGQGQLSESTPGGSNAGGSTEITISPAPVAKELTWIFSLTGVILALGFYNLLTLKNDKEHSTYTVNATDDSVAADITSSSSNAVTKPTRSRKTRRKK
ncbi:MAG: hypothetical protein CMN58_06990 [Solibacterales bacterium]|nr:hypothetical protein [Bryobacterales bacterium]